MQLAEQHFKSQEKAIGKSSGFIGGERVWQFDDGTDISDLKVTIAAVFSDLIYIENTVTNV